MKKKIMHSCYIICTNILYQASAKVEKDRFTVCSDINPNGDQFNHIIKQLCIQYITMCIVQMQWD